MALFALSNRVGDSLAARFHGSSWALFFFIHIHFIPRHRANTSAHTRALSPSGFSHFALSMSDRSFVSFYSPLNLFTTESFRNCLSVCLFCSLFPCDSSIKEKYSDRLEVDPHPTLASMSGEKLRIKKPPSQQHGRTRGRKKKPNSRIPAASGIDSPGSSGHVA